MLLLFKPFSLIGLSPVDITQQAEQIIEAAASDDSRYDFGGSRSPERIAWIALLGAFALFCVMTLGSAFAFYHYLFRSTVPMPALLHVSKGTVGITGADLRETVERNREDLTNTVTSISTDSLSQATIQFRNPARALSEADQLLAAVTLQGNTFVTFNRAIRPRFDWSQAPQRVQFSRLRGQLDIILTDLDDRPFEMDIYTDDLNTDKGLHVQFVTQGRYRLNVSEDEVRLLNLAGAVNAFFGDDPGLRNPVKPGETLVVRIGNRSIRPLNDTVDLLDNGGFSFQGSTLGQMYSPGVPLNWDCSLLPQRNPPGLFSLAEYDGRVGVRLQRFNNATSHGAVTCLQEFEGEGLDVRHIDSLSVLATFSLNYQSLSLCGREGSECPLMLHLLYTTDENNTGSWFRGFYYEDRASGAHKKICASCFQDHVAINPSVWHTFDSGNLLNLFSEERRPAFINAIRFYASGHQFDTVVSELMLLAVDSSAMPASG